MRIRNGLGVFACNAWTPLQGMKCSADVAGGVRHLCITVHCCVHLCVRYKKCTRAQREKSLQGINALLLQLAV